MNRRESLKLLVGSAAMLASGMPRLASAQSADPPFKLPPLGYPFEALEPHIDAQTMMIHHDRHHAAYVNNCNDFAKQVPELGTTPIEKTLADPAYLPVTIQPGVKNNLGGHWNHTFFWQSLSPEGGEYLERLGKHKTSKGCLYIKRLSDVDTGVLEEMINATMQRRKKK